ncbi:MAG: PHP domain-containing protein [Candidatus Zixiibacteriota bacterium]
MVRKYIRKVISKAEIDRYRDAGYKTFDPHLHTGFSYDTIPNKKIHPITLYRQMIDRGWDFVTFTDHDTFLAHDTFDESIKKQGKLISGAEISIKPDIIDGDTDTHTLHVNVLDISKNQYEDIKEIAKSSDYEAFLDYLKMHEIPNILNHPTWLKRGETGNWKLLPKIIADFDVIEVFNRQHIRELNDISFEIAANLGKGIVASSDSHCGTPRIATLAAGDDFRHMWDNIKNNRSVIVDQHLDVKAIALEFLGYVNMMRTMDKDLFPGKRPFVKSKFADYALHAHQFSDLLLNTEKLMIRWLYKERNSGIRMIEQLLARIIINRQQREYANIKAVLS